MPKNIIFLDVDGVLNFVTCKDFSPGGYTGIADSRVKILAEIVKENDADIILTSTWKRNWTKHANLKDLQDPDATYMDEKLAKYGLVIREKTEDHWSNRGFGICSWLYTHEHGNWIVLDDEKFEDYKGLQIMPRLIETSFGTDGGLKPKHIERAKKLFEKPDDHNETRKAMYALQKILDGFAIEETVYSLGKEENGKQCLIIKGNQTAEVFFPYYKRKQDYEKFDNAEEAAKNLIRRIAPTKELSDKMLASYDEELKKLH